MAPTSASRMRAPACRMKGVLHLKDSFLDRVEIERIGQQIENVTAPRLQQLVRPSLAIVGQKVIHYDHLPGSESGYLGLPNVRLKHRRRALAPR